MSENRKTTELSGQDRNDLRQLPAWTRRYAIHRRGLIVVIGLLINLAVFAAIAGGSYIGGEAYRDGRVLTASLGIGLAIVGCLGAIVMALTGAGHRLPEVIAGRLLAGDEGEANLSPPATLQKRRIALLMATVFGGCILAQVFLGDGLAVRYQQPVAALYVVPFLLSLWFLNRPASGVIQLLWPALVGLHAILLLGGAPILFTGSLESLNFVIPVVGYGIVTHLISHCYARIALRKVRRLSAVDGPSK